MTYEAEARFTCRISGSTNDVTIGKRTGSMKTHPSFNATSITQRLFAVPAKAVDTVPDNDKNACFAKASAYVKAELAPEYSIDPLESIAMRGHAWIEGRWQPIPPSFVSYAFPVLRNNERIEDESTFEDPAGKEQAITLSWWVVIQPK